jgi:hypothetical protein
MALQPRHYVIGLFGATVAGGLAWLAFRTEPVAVDLAEVARAPMRSPSMPRARHG